LLTAIQATFLSALFERAPPASQPASDTMTDYSKLKVTDLKDLLSARSLPVSGKKEELIARLTESDAATPTADDLGDLAPPEEDYDWDTPATKTYLPGMFDLNARTAETETKPAAAPAAAPSSAPKQSVETPNPTAATTTANSPPAPAPTTAPTAADTTDADAALAAELEKRKRRAERFGIPLEESAKALERARKFGIQPNTATTENAKKAARGKKFGNQVWTNNGNAKNEETKKPVEPKKAAETKAPAPAKKTVLEDPVEAEKAKKRLERFGGGNEAKKVKS